MKNSQTMNDVMERMYPEKPETDQVTLLDVYSDLYKYRMSLCAAVELFELKHQNEEAQLVRMITEAMEVTEQMVQYIMTAPRATVQNP